jgi:hypothetical protein
MLSLSFIAEVRPTKAVKARLPVLKVVFGFAYFKNFAIFSELS